MALSESAVGKLVDISRQIAEQVSVVNPLGAGAIIGAIEGLIIGLTAKIEQDERHLIPSILFAVFLILDIVIASNVNVPWLVGALIGMLAGFGVEVILPKLPKKNSS